MPPGAVIPNLPRPGSQPPCLLDRLSLPKALGTTRQLHSSPCPWDPSGSQANRAGRAWEEMTLLGVLGVCVVGELPCLCPAA